VCRDDFFFCSVPTIAAAARTEKKIIAIAEVDQPSVSTRKKKPILKGTKFYILFFFELVYSLED
jgi:hypothetical protein